MTRYRKKPVEVEAVQVERMHPCKPDIFEQTYEAVNDAED